MYSRISIFKPQHFTSCKAAMNKMCCSSKTHISETGFVGCFIEKSKPNLTEGSSHIDTKLNSLITKEATQEFENAENKHIFLRKPNIASLPTYITITKRSEKDQEANDNRDDIRSSVAKGVTYLQNSFKGCSHVYVDPCGDAEAAAEGAYLSAFVYDELKKVSNQKTKINFDVYSEGSSNPENVISDWNCGVRLAEGQNLARKLMETPANVMTPRRFAEVATDILGDISGVTVTARDEQWIKEERMGAFLGVARGSREPPVFLEMVYEGNPKAPEDHIALIGKGVTFDSGGISIKPSASMDLMRGDMGGAAVMTGALYSLAQLRPSINVRVYIPLCENMPDGNATKPGDVLIARNGLSIQVDNTDAEGRLILADALSYASQAKPRLVMSAATLTGAMSVALGSAYAGMFARKEAQSMATLLQEAGVKTGDPVWPMPFETPAYVKAISKSQLADLNNISSGKGGGACTAAAFLGHFVPPKMPYVHLDIAGVMENNADIPYLCKGMSGRPTRTIVQFLRELSKSA